ncbi:uncharacterized protein LOC143276824 [Babylonia areolata]|uniref:uncharacterized protein LOC143276824 n=1 Tax=Babylonia areolata TaxID=304850 RepID=UPI003FD10218
MMVAVMTMLQDQGWQEGVAGSGDGVDSTDDEDLVSSGSGSGGGGIPYDAGVDRPPTADAGPDVVIYLPQNSVRLCGNGSDDRHYLSYEWIKKTSLLSADMTGVRTVCMTLSNLQIGDYAFTLVVTDSSGNKATSDINVFVKPGITSPDPQTSCQQLREASRDVYGTYVPRCTPSGDFHSLQCRGHKGTSTCWCVDLEGREIPGTATFPPSAPDCEEGSNLPPCVFMLVRQMRSRLLGGFKPKCTLEGLFQTKQCSGSMCYCVETESGVRIPNTEAVIPAEPVCDGTAVRPTPEKEVRKITLAPPEQETPPPQPAVTTKVVVNIDEGSGQRSSTKKPVVSNESAGSEGESSRQPSSAAHIMTQPGILAAIIGGSVVLLLCAVLLVMFVVYRMRKKDEGSYALDEPKKMPNYSYQRAPDKEFYA